MADQPPLRDYSRSRAVVIGTWKYDFLGQVPAAEHSMLRMAGLLTGPLCGWPVDRLLLVENESGPGDLPDRLITAFDGISDVALFYYVGHGQIAQDDELCLGLKQSRTEANRRASTSLKFSDVRQALQESDAAAKIVILDCCFAGLATKATLAGGLAGDGVLNLTAGTGAYTMAATSAYSTAWYEDDPGLDRPQTYFTKYLADLVEAGIPGQPSRLRLDPLFKQLQENLTAAGRPVPRSRAVNDAREFAFAYNAASPEFQRDPEQERASLSQQLAETGAQVQLLEALAAERKRELARLNELMASTEPRSTGQQRQLQEAIDDAARQLNETQAAQAAAAQVAITVNPDQLASTSSLDLSGSGQAAQHSRRAGQSAPEPPGRPGWVDGVRRISGNLRVRVGAGIAVAAVLAIVLVRVLVPSSGKPTPLPTPSPSPDTCASGKLTLIGSAAFGPIAQGEADAYMSICKNKKPQITVKYDKGIGSAYGVSTVEYDVVHSPATGASEIAMYDGTTTTLDTPVRLPSTPVGVVMFSVIEHVGAISGSSIGIDQLTKLYTQPDGLPGKLAVGYQEGSASRLALFDMLKQSASTFPNRCPPPSGSAGCYESSYPDELTFLEKTPNTIGYMAINHVGGQHLTDYPEISVLNIGPVAPTLENVRNGSYKFTEVEHLYTSPQPSSLVKSFVEYLQRNLTQYVAQQQPSDFLACSSPPKKLC